MIEKLELRVGADIKTLQVKVDSVQNSMKDRFANVERRIAVVEQKITDKHQRLEGSITVLDDKLTFSIKRSFEKIDSKMDRLEMLLRSKKRT